MNLIISVHLIISLHVDDLLITYSGNLDKEIL